MDIMHPVDLFHCSSDFVLLCVKALENWAVLKSEHFPRITSSFLWNVEGKGTLEQGLGVASLCWANNHWSQVSQEHAQ